MLDYVRVSVDKSGRERSTDEQHDELIADAAQQGWSMGTGTAYRDTGSASRYARKRRDHFDRLIADLASGSFGADILGLWESSRGSRRVGEWVTLVDLLEENRVKVWVHTHRRLYDPSIPRDRRTLLEDAVKDEYSSAETSERVLRNTAAAAIAGAPHGLCPYGYEREYDLRTGNLVRQTPKEPEASIVREVFKRTLAGHTMHAIARDFAERGIEKPSGGPFLQAHLRQWLDNPAYAGLRMHRPGQAARRRARNPTDEVAKLSEGTWDEIVDRQDWLDVRALIAERARARGPRPRYSQHLLSGIAVCDKCLDVAYASTRNGNRNYRCQIRGCASVPADELEDLVRDTILAWAGKPAQYAKLIDADDQDREELKRVRAQLAEAIADRTELADRVKAYELSLSFAAEVEPGITRRIVALKQQESDLESPTTVPGLLGKPGDDMRQRWEDCTVDSRRVIARALLTTKFVGQLRLVPLGPRRGVELVDRIWFDKGQRRPRFLGSGERGN
jgi:site-specific DNA recombinase